MKHRPHPGQAPGLGVSSMLDDPGVGMRAPQHLGVEHAAHLDVVDEGRIAFDQLQSINLYFRFTHDLGVGYLRAGHHPGGGRRYVERWLSWRQKSASPSMSASGRNQGRFDRLDLLPRKTAAARRIASTGRR